METTEKIVEAYVRYIRHWATIPNIRCAGQREIDLLAIDPKTSKRFHIETSVSNSPGFARLTGTPFQPELMGVPGQAPTMRRTLGYFIERKFEPPEVIAKLAEYGFESGSYTKVIVTWGWTPEAQNTADVAGIELWHFQKIMHEIAEMIRSTNSYFMDDTLRTIGLFARTQDDVEPT